MKAQIANFITSKSISLYEKTYNDCIGKIKQAAKDGNFKVTISTKKFWGLDEWSYENLCYVVDKLKKNGYDVAVYHFVSNEIEVSWK